MNQIGLLNVVLSSERWCMFCMFFLHYPFGNYPGRNGHYKLAIFELTLWVKTHIAYYFIIMYYLEINYGIYTS